MSTRCTWITEHLGGYQDRDRMAANVAKSMYGLNPQVIKAGDGSAIAVAGFFSVSGPSMAQNEMPEIAILNGPIVIIEEEGKVVVWDMATATPKA